MYNGILLINKPAGLTSHDVVGRLRRCLGMKRIGHAGTLDPMARGLLVILLGKATRASDAAMRGDKRYEALFRPGITTDTQDSSGRILSHSTVSLTAEQITDAANAFHGDVLQLPPMYSAIQVGGKRLYQAAREGKEIERQPRHIHVSRFELLPSRSDTPHGDFRLLIDCSKGTYVRTLCHDLGTALGCGGCMSGLTRLRSGEFHLRDALILEEVTRLHERGRLADRLIPVDRAFMDIPALTLGEEGMRRFRNGLGVDSRGVAAGLLPLLGEQCRVYGPGQRFVAVGRHREDGLYSDISFFIEDES